MPEPRGGHAMVYDPSSQQVVLFGGFTMEGGYHSLGDTWTYAYSTNTWTELTLSLSPSARSNFVMVYCNETNEILLYGGGQATDTWSFDCATQTWSEVITSSNPGVHYSHGMAYDSGENAVILFGGFGGDSMETDETWKFSCDTREWTELSPATTPLARYGHVMVYDEYLDQIIMCCGNTAYQGHQDDTWSYDTASNTWTEIATLGNPDRLKWPSMTYDSVNRKCILFGGQIGDIAADGTWVYDAEQNTWTFANSDISPSPRINTGLAYDSEAEAVVLFGGYVLDVGTLDDTWVYSYDTNTWTEIGTEPSTSPTTTTEDLDITVLIVASAGVTVVVGLAVYFKRRRG